jgi:RNA-directed DNA polymerase
VFPSKAALVQESEKIRTITAVIQSHTPLPYLIKSLNRQVTGWANYFSYGYARASLVGDRLVPPRPSDSALQWRSQRPYRPPPGLSRYEHIQTFGLVPLNQRSTSRSAHT